MVGVTPAPRLGRRVSPDRLLLGSEGILGAISQAWVRVRRRPEHRACAAVRFAGFAAGAQAVRAIAQAERNPSNCRLIDAREVRLTGAGDGSSAPLPAAGARPAGRAPGRGEGAAASWREAFLRAPYLRDALIALGVLSETFETAITWERFPALHESITERTERALREVCGGGLLTCRLTHVYPDGPAPYYTVLAPARRGGELEQWAQIKAAASEAVLAGGGTITHHHAVGREHRPWYDRPRPEAFATALRGAKAALDPGGVLNPGVLLS
jgi:alkyldihydroxyacetonephosphate synthase